MTINSSNTSSYLSICASSSPSNCCTIRWPTSYARVSFAWSCFRCWNHLNIGHSPHHSNTSTSCGAIRGIRRKSYRPLGLPPVARRCQAVYICAESKQWRISCSFCATCRIRRTLSDHSGPYVRWPADLRHDLVVVRISTVGLSEYSGEPFAIDTAKTKAALVRHRDLIQRLAVAKRKAGDSVVTLEASDFRNLRLFAASTPTAPIS